METEVMPQQQAPQTMHEKICFHLCVILNNPDVEDTYYRQLTEEERKELSTLVSNRIDELANQQATLQGRLARLMGMNCNDMKREYSLNRIRTVVREHVLNTGYMPSIQKIAEATGLNRRTVAKHIKEYVDGGEDIDQLRLMRRDVMSTVLKSALQDKNLNAAKLYIEEVKT
ncbi:MAG TPA: hypothetical protein VK174_08095, partial [Chitinophagales bacterium]|nr:hypothetical protein [Chitinophagales bacterium]